MVFALSLGCESPSGWSCERANGHPSPGVVDSTEALEPLRDVERICGDLRLEGGLKSVEALAALQVVEGSLVVSGSEITALTLASLVHVEGHFGVTNNAALASVDLPSLSSVGGEFALVDNPTLTQITGDAVQEVGGSLFIADNAQLASISTMGVIDVGAIEVTGNAALMEYSLPPGLARTSRVLLAENDGLRAIRGGEALESVEEIIVIGNPELETIELSIRGDIGSLTISGNAGLVDVAGVDLASGVERLIVENNATLAVSPGLGPVDSVFILYIAHNPALQQFGAQAAKQIDRVTVIYNEALDPNEVSLALAGVALGFLKVDGNAGQQVPHVDSCPWTEDFECDEVQSASGALGTGLCDSDPVDCAY